MKQSHLREAMNECATDLDYPLQSKDVEHENFKYFALCLRNKVYLSPVLNSSRAVRNAVLGIDY
jgi:hypothetical protein